MNSLHCEKIFTLLLENGADMYARDCFQKTVLHYAIEENSTRAVSYLLLKDTSPFSVSVDDRKQLLIAGARAGLEVCKALVSAPHVLGSSDVCADGDAIEILGCTKFLLRDFIQK